MTTTLLPTPGPLGLTLSNEIGALHARESPPVRHLGSDSAAPSGALTEPMANKEPRARTMTALRAPKFMPSP
ncbi:MAG: hypothetical protein QMB23_03910 [Candidatus Nanopelagicales bacterium]